MVEETMGMAVRPLFQVCVEVKSCRKFHCRCSKMTMMRVKGNNPEFLAFQ